VLLSKCFARQFLEALRQLIMAFFAQGANRQCGGESARGRKIQETNESGGETAKWRKMPDTTSG